MLEEQAQVIVMFYLEDDPTLEELYDFLFDLVDNKIQLGPPP
jgi:hypothetical protein